LLGQIRNYVEKCDNNNGDGKAGSVEEMTKMVDGNE